MKNILHYLVLIFGAPLIWCYIRLIQITSKLSVSGEGFPDRLQAENKGHLFVFWHNRQIVLPILRSNDTVHCLISDSRDGEYMASLVKLFGKKAIRGSSSRNGMAAMKTIMRLLRDGEAVGIATDGPRGPAFEVKPGVVQMAQALQVPIIPVSFDATRKKVLSSWDSTFLLYPFGRISIVYGDPIMITPEQSVTQACEVVRAGIVKADNSAAAALG